MADLVAALLQDTALDLMLEPYSVADEKAIRELPKPMYEGTCMEAEGVEGAMEEKRDYLTCVIKLGAPDLDCGWLRMHFG